MCVFKLERSQELDISIDEAWAYFSNPLNLAEITPPSLGLSIKGSYNGKTTNGMIIEYTVKPLWGLSLDWVSEIKHVQAPNYFVDDQKLGPYKLWYHQHIFEPLGRKQVRIRDIVHYALPFGILSLLVNESIIKGKLENIFNYRKSILEKKFKRESLF